MSTPTTVTWSKGITTSSSARHRTLEALTPLGFNGSDNYGTFGYSNAGNGVGQYTGVDFADFLLGIPNNTFYDVVEQDNDGKSTHYHFFAQDRVEGHAAADLSYGVRYEYHPGYYDPNGDIGNFDPQRASPAAPSIRTASRACWRRPSSPAPTPAIRTASPTPTRRSSTARLACLLNQQRGRLPLGPEEGSSPALHAALWRCLPPTDGNDKTVVRGGFGMYNITMLGSSFYSLTGTLQARPQQYTNTYNPPPMRSATSGRDLCRSGRSCSAPATAPDYFGTANSTNWKDPYTEQWSLER
jgi:hypothetical protein